MYTMKRMEKYTPSSYLFGFFIGSIQKNLEFYVRVRAFEKRVNGKQPLSSNENRTKNNRVQLRKFHQLYRSFGRNRPQAFAMQVQCSDYRPTEEWARARVIIMYFRVVMPANRFFRSNSLRFY